MQTIKKDLNGRDNEALSRYTLIAPLLDESLDPAKRSQLREEAASKSGLSERTIFLSLIHILICENPKHKQRQG